MTWTETYPLEDLFSPDVGQSAVQLLDLGNNAVDLALVFGLDLARLANGHVDGEFDSAARHAGVAEPSANADSRGARRREAYPVIAGIGRGEGEFRGFVGGGGLLVYNTVVVVEGFVNGDADC